MEIDARKLLKILPHRYPFLLVDRVLEVEPGKRIVVRKNVTNNEPYFVGHFPENPIMPGVMQLELMAQAACVMFLVMPEFSGWEPRFAGIDNARFRRPVVPGDIIEVTVETIKTRGSMGWAKAEATVDGKTVSECEMSFALVKPEGGETE
ncbi:MAG: 3-hydroxyacyl-ACP dehydratase FabZ [Armatimonas sp.]